MHGWLAVFSGNIPYMTSKHKTVKRAKAYIDVVLDKEEYFSIPSL